MNHPPTTCRRWRPGFLLGFTLLSLAAVSRGHDLVERQHGDIPIILSAPHGGALDVPGATPREGVGLVRKPGGFVTSRDTGTEELARRVAEEMARRFGRKPYYVLSRAHRKYLDPNRKPEQAYECEPAQAVYDSYHAALAEACRDVKARFQAGLLLDIHGQGSARDTVFRGTQHGKTVTLLRQRFGEDAFAGESSLMGRLKARGWKVHPDPFYGREQAGFTGGFIVQRYGSHGEFGIDAIQLEFGGNYRAASARGKVATELAAAVGEYAASYLHWKPPPASTEPAINSPADAAPIKDKSSPATAKAKSLD